jgi:hypothetical protein
MVNMALLLLFMLRLNSRAAPSEVQSEALTNQGSGI